MQTSSELYPMRILFALCLIAAFFNGACDVAQTPEDSKHARMLAASDSIRRIAFDDADAALGGAVAFYRAAEAGRDTVAMQLAQRTLALSLIYSGRSDTARTVLESVLAHASMAGDSAALLDAHKIRAIFYSSISENDSCMLAVETAMQYVGAAHDSTIIGFLHSQRASAASNVGDSRQAVWSYLEAARIFEAAGEKRRLATVYGNIGTEHSRVENNLDAIRYFRKAIELNTSIKSEADLARDYANIAVSYKNISDYENAEKSLRTSLALARKLKLTTFIAQNHLNLGTLNERRGRYDEARKYFDSSIALCRRENIAYGVMLNTAALGALDARLRRFGSALTQLHDALNSAIAMGSPYEQIICKEQLSAAYEAKGDHALAFRYLNESIALKDSLIGNENAESLKRTEIEFEYRRKEAENLRLRMENDLAGEIVARQRLQGIGAAVIVVLLVALLVVLFAKWRGKRRALVQIEAQKRIVEQTSEQLAESNSLKDLLLDIITHDLIAPVNVINGAVEELAERPDDRRLVQLINRGGQQVIKVARSAALLSRVVVDSNIPKEQLALRALVSEAEASWLPQLQGEDMHFENRVPDHMRVLANPVLLEAFKNIIGNAIRHASEGGAIIVEAREDHDTVLIRFEDRGETIPEESRTGIFRRRVQLRGGAMGGQGLGLAIVERIVRAHGGTVWVEAAVPHGNVFCLRLPQPMHDAEQVGV